MNPFLPDPNACSHCHLAARGHMQQWTEAVGWHKWAEPTDAQRLERMKARRAARIAAKTPQPACPEPLVEFTVEDTLTPAIKGALEEIDFMLWDDESKEDHA
jgi:hypothetical protein